jgi:C1A family cysteine protease
MPISKVALLLTGGASLATAGYDPTVPFQAAKAFEVDMLFQIPYMNFTEPVYGWYDTQKGFGKLSYYSGMDTYIYDSRESSTSHAVYPVQDTLTCFRYPSDGYIPEVFPEMKYFTKQDGTEIIVTQAHPSGVQCDIWTYAFDTVSDDPSGGGTAVLPNDDGYSGQYVFYVNAKNGKPVQFHMYGHNVAVGGSHVDEYILDYLDYQEVDKVADFLFKPPSGMPCHEGSNPFGPTAHKRKSNPKEDFHMMFPQGAEKREEVFKAYTKQYSKLYDGAEYHQRKALYHRALRYINAANRRSERTYTLAANHLADYTYDEKKAMRGRNAKVQAKSHAKEDPQSFCGEMTVSGKTLPDEVDWRSKAQGGFQPEPGLVLPPKDQGTCGSCWTYGTTGTVEGAMAKATGKLVALSEQSIMDCAWTPENFACDGGNDFSAFKWLLTEGNQGRMATHDSYGDYKSQNGFCHYDLGKNESTNPWTGNKVQAGAQITSCVNTSPQWKDMETKTITDQEANDAMNDALFNIGPLSVSIDASPDDFYYYHSGYYYNSDCTWNDLDHTVLAVGYTTVNGQRYTLVRNSWSTHWGDEGYVWISQKDNCCGVATTPIFATLK